MSDDIGTLQQPDRAYICLSQDDEIRFWTLEFGVSEWELRNAIQRAGNAPAEVRKFLRRH